MSPTEFLLRNLSRHASFSPTEEARIAAAFELAQYAKRTVLVAPGSVDSQFYFVVEGCLRLSLPAETGHGHVLQFAVEDWWISELQSFLDGVPARLCLDALEDSRVLQVSRESWASLTAEAPRVERAFRILAQRGLGAMQQRLVDVLSQSAMERYLAFRKRYGALEGRLPQHQIAAYIGVTPEFLSALRRRLARSKAV